jgi:vitamin B12 transporter
MSAACALSPLAFAEDGQSNIENVIVSGARLENAQAAQSTVLELEDIKRRSPASAADLLRNNVGIDLIQPSGPGGVTELFIRGAESNFTVVSIDGIRVNDTTNSRGGGFDLSSLNPDSILRVEIMRGPLSATFGSDALAGAVNIVTRNAQSSAPVSGRIEVGSEDYRRAYASLSAGDAEGLSGTATLAYLDSGEPVQGSSSENTSFNAQLDYVTDGGARLDTSLRVSERERTAYPASSGGPRLAASDALEFAESDDLSVGARWRQALSENWNLDFQLNHFDREETVDTPAIAPGVVGSPVPAMVSESELQRDRVTGFASYDFSAKAQLAFGLDFEREDGDSDTVLDFGFPVPAGFELSRDTQAAFAELNFESEQGINLFLSTRYDDVEGADSQNSSKIALAYKPRGGMTRFGVNWGGAFKMPSFYALGDALVGNTELEPETSTSSELFVEQFLFDGKWRLSGALFDSDYQNLIDFDFMTFSMVNRGEITISGIELESVWRVSPNLELGAHVTQTDYDLDEGENLDGRPELRGGLFGEWRSASWSARAHAYHSGERSSSSNATGQVELDAYTRVDAVLVHSISRQLDLSVSIDNLFDENYEDEVGFPSPGRIFRLGLAFEL